MADDLQDRGACDRSRVKLQEDYEIRHRPQKRGITKDKLVETVRPAGVSAQAVARELGRSLP